MDDAYLHDVSQHAEALIGALMPEHLCGPRSIDEWHTIQDAIEAGFAAGGLRAPELRRDLAGIVVGLAQSAR